MTPTQKDDLTKLIILILFGALAGGGAGYGSVLASGGVQGTVTVRVDGPIKAELPPDQAALLQANALLIPSINRLDETVGLFFSQYREDQADNRKVNDALRAAIFDVKQRVGLVEREAREAGAAAKSHDDRLRMIERNMERTP